MTDLATLQAQRLALTNARFTGQQRVRVGNSEITFKTDAEMKAALADLDRQISALQMAQITSVKINASKGF